MAVRRLVAWPDDDQQPDPRARRHYRHNFTVHFIDGVFALAGIAALGIHTIVPGLLHEVAERYPHLAPIENRLATAATVAFAGLGPLAAFLLAGWSESDRVRKPKFLKWAVLSRLAFPLVALATAALGQHGLGLFLVLFYLGLSLRSLADGAVRTQWLDFIGRQIPATRRGILLGGRSAVGILIGVGIVAAFPALSRRVDFPYNYALLFLLAALLYGASFVSLARMREIPYSEEEIRPRRHPWARLRENLALVGEDPVFRNLLIATAIANLLTMATSSLVTLKALRVLDLSGAAIVGFTSLVTMCLTISQAVASPAMGVAADRLGYKRLGYITYTVLIVALGVALTSQAAWGFLISIALFAFVQSGRGLIELNMVLEVAPEDRRPSYVGVRALSSLPALFMPIVGGWIADRTGHDTVFWAGIALAIVSIVAFRALVYEPRDHQP
ncbi:MAG: MFS transporter [Armatimonadia bacterium]|nr:MFS transporter [Armatimonadia bacterium]